MSGWILHVDPDQFLASDPPAYDDASERVMGLLRDLGHLLEVWGWDEAYPGTDRSPSPPRLWPCWTTSNWTAPFGCSGCAWNWRCPIRRTPSAEQTRTAYRGLGRSARVNSTLTCRIATL